MIVIAAGSVLLVLLLAGILVVGVRRVGDASIASKYAIGIAAWLALTGVLGALGVFSEFSARPPRLMIAVVCTFTLFTIATRGATAKRIIFRMPLTWPIAIHSMRVFVEIGLWGLYENGKLPRHLTFEGRNFDVIVGLTAPLVAFALSRRLISTKVVVGWNILSIGLLANIVVMAITSVPGPLHIASWPGPANTIVAEFPYIWLPTFLVPIALFGHIVSLRQILGVNTPHHDEEPLGRRRRQSSNEGHLSKH